MKFKLGIETEIGAIELEISQLQARLQQIKDFQSKAVALLHLAKELADSKSLVDDITIEGLADEVADILDPVKPEPEPEQPAKEESEPEEKPLAIGTRVKSIYSEMFGTVENFKKAPPATRYRYQYNVKWDNPPIDTKQTYWDTELIEQPYRQLTTEEAINNNTDKSVTPGSLITIGNPNTGETISWVVPETKNKNEFKIFDTCYIAEGTDAGHTGVVVDMHTSGEDFLIWVKPDGKTSSMPLPAQDLLKVQLIADTIHQCSDGRLLLDCSKKNLAVGWQELMEAWDCDCKIVKLDKLWRVEIKGLSAERLEKLIKLHPSADTPCPESSLGKPLQPGMPVRITKCEKGWEGTEVIVEKECEIQADSWWVLLPDRTGRGLYATANLEPVEQLATA